MSRRMFNDDELFQLITKCRNSDLPDFQWCKEHGIKENEIEQNTPFSRSISTSCNPTVEITTDTMCIRFTNEIHPELLGTILSAIGGTAYGR